MRLQKQDYGDGDDNLRWDNLPPLVQYYRKSNASYTPPMYGLLSILDKMHLTGENPLETAKRIIVNEALTRTHGHQKDAAKILGISERVMNDWCRDLRLRPIDRRAKETP